MNTALAGARKAHVAIHVKNVEASVEFYRKLFGMEPSKVRRGYARFDVANPPLNFSLNEGGAGKPGVLSHLGIQVGSTAEVLAMREQWIERGLLTRDEMKTECCYAFLRSRSPKRLAARRIAARPRSYDNRTIPAMR